MKLRLCLLTLVLAAARTAPAQVPENLVVENIPPVAAAQKRDVGRYLEFRAAVFDGWHPTRHEMLITTRFADTPQLHHVKMPGGARRQLTFSPEPVRGASFRPKTGEFIVFSQDAGGGEFFQLFRLDPADGRITLLTDGKSRNTGARWARSGKQLAFTSTHRNGKDNDIWLMDPANPAGNKLVLEVSGGGWNVLDWSHDETKLLLGEYISANKSHLHLLDLQTGKRDQVTPDHRENVSYAGGRFAPDASTVYTTSDEHAEFRRLTRIDLATQRATPWTAQIPWDVEEFDLSPDGHTIAFLTNEDGVGVLHLLSTHSGREIKAPQLPVGVPSGLEWHENGRDLAFNLSSARSPNDVYSVNVKSG